MENQSFFEKLFVWFPGLLVAISLVSLLIYNDSKLEWMGRLARISCGFFWIMPAIYLLISPNLTIHFINLLWKITRPSSRFNTGLEQNRWTEKTHRKQLNDKELSIVYLFVIVGIIIGGYIFLNSFGVVPP